MSINRGDFYQNKYFLKVKIYILDTFFAISERDGKAKFSNPNGQLKIEEYKGLQFSCQISPIQELL